MWLAANTKNCPKCEHPIEKNQGCNVMRCYSCRHEFCWDCMRPWAEHDGVHFKCSIFDDKKHDKAFMENIRNQDALQA